MCRDVAKDFKTVATTCQQAMQDFPAVFKLTNFTVSVVFFHRILFRETQTSHPLDTLAGSKARHLHIFNMGAES